MEEPELKRAVNRDIPVNLMIKKADSVAEEVGNLWQTEAACTTEDPEMWFPPAKRTKDSYSNTRKAVDICFTKCPVRLQCLKAACLAREAAGIWGGLDFSTRRGDGVPRRAHDYDALSVLPHPYE